MADAEGLWRTLRHIKANPQDWNQMRWCHCFAGWTVRLNNPNLTLAQDQHEFPVLRDGDDVLDSWDIAEEAQRLLDLNTSQATALFRMFNTLGELETIVKELTAQAV